MDDENFVRFISVAKRHDLVPSIPMPIESLRDSSQIDQWHREKGMLDFALREPQIGGSVVDILVRPDVPFDLLLRSAVVGELYGKRVWIASIDNLLTMKRIANRPKDPLDIAALEKIKRGEDPNVRASWPGAHRDSGAFDAQSFGSVRRNAGVFYSDVDSESTTRETGWRQGAKAAAAGGRNEQQRLFEIALISRQY